MDNITLATFKDLMNVTNGGIAGIIFMCIYVINRFIKLENKVNSHNDKISETVTKQEFKAEMNVVKNEISNVKDGVNEVKKSVTMIMEKLINKGEKCSD